MRNPLQILVGIDQTVHKLNPTAMLGRLDERIRGGLPGSSLPDGSPSANKPIPHLDRNDLDAIKTRNAYIRALELAARHIEEARRLETGEMPEQYMTPKQLLEHHKRMSRLATELKSPTAVQCANCHRHVERTANDRLRRGRCHACYEYLTTHGSERPRELWEQDVERQLTQTA